MVHPSRDGRSDLCCGAAVWRVPRQVEVKVEVEDKAKAKAKV